MKQPRLMITVNDGDRVKRRGMPFVGTVEQVSGKWVAVKWDDGQSRERPLLCHLNELESAGL